MHDVREFRFETPSRTRLWFSDRAAKDIARFRRKGDPNRSFWKRVQRCAENGFANYEHGVWPIVKAEWDGIYRFGVRDSRFRMIGFYKDESKRDFIVMETLTKSGQNLSGPERGRVDVVAKIKKNHHWRMVYDEEDFPRLAEGT